MVNKKSDRKPLSMKRLIDSSYLPLETLNKIRDDRKLLEFSHMLPHWFQRRILEIKQVFDVGILGFSRKKELDSGIYARVLIDDSHQVVICVHKYRAHFIDIQVAERTYKSLKAIIKDLQIHSHISIINGMDFCVGLPDEFFDSCPKWNEDEIIKASSLIEEQLNDESEDYCMESASDRIGIICDRHYLPGAWNVTIYPSDMNNESLAFIKAARTRIDNLLIGLKKDNRIYSDVAIGVLPLDSYEMIQYD